MTEGDLLGQLIEASHFLAPDHLPEELRRVALAAGLADTAAYLCDYGQRRLMPLRADAGPEDHLEIDSTVAGRAFRLMEVVAVPDDSGGVRLWLPILDGTDRLGVLGVTVPEDTEEVRRRGRHLAGLVALILLSKEHYGDGLRRARRVRDLSLAAELRWDMLPPLTVMTPVVDIAAILEPAYEVAGDCFDYALNGPTAHFALFDAVGHGLESARIGNLALGAYRNLRHQGTDLASLYWGIDAVLVDQFGSERFVTAQMAELDMPSGRLSWLNAGHPPPILLRRGRTHDLLADPAAPMGLGLGTPPQVSTYALEPGDLALFFTDGVVEARSADGDLFGRERLAQHLVRAAQSEEPAPEMVRRLVHAVLDHEAGQLRDDASLLLVRWEPPDEA